MLQALLYVCSSEQDFNIDKLASEVQLDVHVGAGIMQFLDAWAPPPQMPPQPNTPPHTLLPSDMPPHPDASISTRTTQPNRNYTQITYMQTATPHLKVRASDPCFSMTSRARLDLGRGLGVEA